MEQFDIIEYLSGLTQFVFDKSVLKRIAIDRDVAEVTDYEELEQKTKDLLKADILYAAYNSPTMWASSTNSHGSYTNSVGGQTLNAADRERLYNTFYKIYKKYDDPILEFLDDEGGLDWLE